MEQIEYEKMYKVEDKYWWFVGKRFLIKNFLKKYYNSRKDLKLLDVGCGTGIIMKMLEKYGNPYGIDISDSAIGFCKLRNLHNVVKSDVSKLELDDNYFDVVTCLDILYHKEVKDDVVALKEINRVLKPGGRLFFTDSAMMCLYSKHDLAHHGIRRYSTKELKEKLSKSGFKVEKISYFNSLLFPFVYLSRKLSKLSDKEVKSDIEEDINPLFNKMLMLSYKTELYLLNYLNYIFGVSIFAVARKK